MDWKRAMKRAIDSIWPTNLWMPQNQAMPPTTTIATAIFLLFLFLLVSYVGIEALVSDYNENANGIGIVELRRAKRGEHDMLDFGRPQGDLVIPTFPSDYEIEDDNKEEEEEGGSAKKGKARPETTEHTYYNMTIHSNDEEAFSNAYVDVESWIKQGGAEGQTEHSHLDDAYRKAAGVRLKFEFPFYGHRLQNLTIATGGFLYVGDQTHSWLAATQYIAPLMANFDTMLNQSSIQYADDGKRMIVEWSEVTLRDNRQAGNFSFQVHLWRNGNISFVYKEVPISIGNISDAQHPCKLGISDAYLFNHKVSTPSQSAPQSKRVIHEYHRITIPSEKIGPKTVVLLKALPTCLEATTCDDCIKKQLKQFKCSWCNPKENGKGTKELGMDGANGGGGMENNRPFCSDQLGLHRRRQEWIEGHCQIQEENQYCKADEILMGGVDNTTAATPDPALVPKDAVTASTLNKPIPSSSGPEPTTAVNAKSGGDKPHSGDGDNGSGGIAFVTLFMLVAISASVWIAYAYFNPHTRSGQLLIKYRPSKWQIPSSHVRYSASVHM